ncbi:MAG: GatB/YqeY domain-containing protein [Rhizobacter sp.]|nr:GatB/YqeY domain-containing protein [Burkholderiaceae bacterium]MCO5122616.1 GatB/YqeY domain-containing protein [Rhizobacter sp.]
MSLKDRITDDMKAAMRAREADRLLAIRGLLAAIKQREVDERIELDDAAVTAIIDKLIKQRKDSIAQFEAGGRADLVAKERAELGVLEAYLPERMGADEIAREVAVIAAALGAELARPLAPADMGRLMAAAKRHFAGKADMGSVSAAVKGVLSA